MTGGLGGTTVPEKATGGSGGTDAGALCDELVADYQSAIIAEQSCTLGAAGQCRQSVPAVLSVCGGCPTFVNDTSKLTAIQDAWQGAGCNDVRVSCFATSCPAALNNVCVAGGNGTGVCAFVPSGAAGNSGGAGGNGGGAGSGGADGAPADAGAADCSELTAQYAAALASAQRCSTDGPNPCTVSVPASVHPCSPGCVVYVTDATQFNLISRQWYQAGCDVGDLPCPNLDCPPAQGGMCVPTSGDGGGFATCETVCAPGAEANP